MSNSDVALREISEMQDKHAGNFAVAPETSRYRQVQLCRHYVRKIVKAHSSLMAVDPLSGFAPIPGPERPKHQVWALASRKASQSIDSSMLTNPITGLDVVGMRVFGKACGLGLLRCKEALLTFGNLVEPLGGFFAFISHGTILQLI
jgi:hypothetical protein